MKNNDISPALAILCLIFVVALFFGLKNYQYLMANWNPILNLLENSSTFLSILGGSVVFNNFVLVFILERTFGYKKQGSRLRSLNKAKSNIKGVLVRLGLAFLPLIFAIPGIEIFAKKNSTSLIYLLPENIYFYLIDGFVCSIVLGIGILLYGGLSLFAKWFEWFNLKSKSLPFRTSIKNHLTLGSIGEEKNNIDTERPKWVVIPEKALNGNMLITGSIGSGKTQGTILPYVEQLFTNFSNVPTALVLDPKGSFISKVVDILKSKGLEEKCINIGDVHANI